MQLDGGACRTRSVGSVRAGSGALTRRGGIVPASCADCSSRTRRRRAGARGGDSAPRRWRHVNLYQTKKRSGTALALAPQGKAEAEEPVVKHQGYRKPHQHRNGQSSVTWPPLRQKKTAGAGAHILHERRFWPRGPWAVPTRSATPPDEAVGNKRHLGLFPPSGFLLHPLEPAAPRALGAPLAF